MVTTMRNWTEQDVIEKLDEGWLLSGDIGGDAPFALINQPGDNSSARRNFGDVGQPAGGEPDCRGVEQRGG